MTEGGALSGCPHCAAGYRVPYDWLGREVACRVCGERFVLEEAGAETPVEPGSETLLTDEDAALRIGRLAVRFRMISAERLEAILERQRSAPADRRRRIGELLIETGSLTPQQVEFLASVQQVKALRMADRRFGDLAVQSGLATEAQVAAAMEMQKQRFLERREKVPVSDLLIAQGVLTAAQRDALLASPPETSTRATLTVSVSDDHLQATVTRKGEGQVAREAVLEALSRAGVVFGIDPAAVDAFVGGEVPVGEPWVVARAQPPTPPVDGRIEFLFESYVPQAGRELDASRIDFRDRGEIPQVAPGDVLARKVPGSRGTPGTDLFGKPLTPAEPKEPPLGAGIGAELSEDKTTVTAAAEGRPSVSASGIVSVYPEYQVDGDVGFETGHIEFHGRVLVKGTVKNGFRVRCGELVAGEIQGADIEVSGDVRVNGGIIGARIHAGGQLIAHFLQKAKCQVLGDVVVAKEVVESTVECSGAFLSPRCQVIVSEITAKQGIFAASVGSEASSPSRLSAGVDDPAAREAARLEAAVAVHEAAIAERQEEAKGVRERLRVLEQLIGEAAQVQDRSLLRQRELKSSLEAMERAGLQDKAESFRQELAAIDARLAESEQQLSEWFDEQERLGRALEELPNLDAEDREAAEALNRELEQLRAWQAREPGSPVIQVDGALHAHTILRTPNGEVRLTDERRHVRFEEQAVKEADGRTRWRLGVAPWQVPEKAN